MSFKKYALVAIILIGFILRFYRLNEFPVHLNHDEVSQLYDAISIAQTGRDAYGNFMPFIFPSVNDFKPPFYTYITSIFYFITGFNEITVRLPGAIFGVLIIPAVYLFTLKLLNVWKIALGAAFLTAVSPFEIFFSRKSFENGAGIFLMLLGFSCLLEFIENSKLKSKKLLYLGSVLFGIAIYTYFSHVIIIPLLLMAFFVIFRKKLGSFGKYIFPAAIFILFALPIFSLAIFSTSASYRSKSVFILQDINLGRIIDYGKTDNAISSYLNRGKTIIDFSFTRYLNQFDPSFIFGNGLDFTNQGWIEIGPLLLVQFPFLLIGIYFLIRNKNLVDQSRFIILWIMLGVIPSGLTFEEHSPHRIIMVFTMINVVSGAGLYLLLKMVARLDLRKLIFSIVILVTIFLFNFLYFMHIYFVNFPNEKSQFLHYPVKEVARFAWGEKDKYEQIIFDPLYGETIPIIGTATHYYFAFYGKYPPESFQKEYRIGDKDREILFDKFSIRKIDWLEDQKLNNVLIIGNTWNIPIHSVEKEKIIKVFNYYSGTPAFYAIKL